MGKYLRKLLRLRIGTNNGENILEVKDGGMTGKIKASDSRLNLD